TTRVAGSSEMVSSSRSSSRSISGVSAFCLTARSKVIVAIGPSLAAATTPSRVSSCSEAIRSDLRSPQGRLVEVDAERLGPEQPLIHRRELGRDLELELRSREHVALQVDAGSDLRGGKPVGT